MKTLLLCLVVLFVIADSSAAVSNDEPRAPSEEVKEEIDPETGLITMMPGGKTRSEETGNT